MAMAKVRRGAEREVEEQDAPEAQDAPEEFALLPPVTGVVGTGGASGTSLPVTGVSGKIQLGMTVTGTGIPAGTTILAQTAGTTPGGAGTYKTSQATTAAALAALTFTAGPALAFFPAFSIIVPPPPIGANKTVPNFPPPTPPPIGTVPKGDLVGPAIAAAAVPPSVAGFVEPRFKTGSATSPTAASWFPSFTSTFPNPTIVFTNTMMIGAPKPPQTASTLNIVLDGWGPYVPPTAPTSPGSDGRFPRSLVAGLEMSRAEVEAHWDEPRPDDESPRSKTRRK